MTKSGPDRYSYENIEYCKVYHTKEAKKELCSLSYPAMRLYVYIINDIGSAEDIITLNIDYLTKYFDLKSKSTVSNAIKELKDINLILKFDGDIYFVNPEYIYCGDRMKKYPDNVRSVRTVKR